MEKIEFGLPTYGKEDIYSPIYNAKYKAHVKQTNRNLGIHYSYLKIIQRNFVSIHLNFVYSINEYLICERGAPSYSGDFGKEKKKIMKKKKDREEEKKKGVGCRLTENFTVHR